MANSGIICPAVIQHKICNTQACMLIFPAVLKPFLISDSIGAEINIAGVIIRSGDIMVADRDGVAVLPQEKIQKALEGMQALRERERNMEQHIAAGMTMPDWVKVFLAGDRVKYIG